MTPGEGPRYHRLHDLGRRGAWRAVLGVALLVVLVIAVQIFASTIVGVLLLVTGTDADTVLDRLSGDPVMPSYLAVVNLGWALAIPVVWFVLWLLHRLHPGWAASVLGRFRWRWFAVCLGIAFLALVATTLVSAALPAQGDAGVEVGGGLNDWTERTRDFVLVVALLTPLQAAGEEYVFRGYLAQAVGGLAGRLGGRLGDRFAMAVAVVVPALLFALAHGLGQDVPIFVDRFAFGLVAGTLVLVTGGLEAGIAMHLLNNFLAFGAALAFGDMTTALTPSDGTWWSLPVTATQSVVFLGGCWWWARRRGVADRATVGVGGAVLEPAAGRV